MKTERIRNTKGTLADKAVLSVMKDWDLKPGQMLLLGPRSVKMLGTRGAYDPRKLTDLMVLDKSEWAC